MVHVMELHADSLIDGMEKCEIVPIWLKQRCWTFVHVKRVIEDLEELESLF
jgi:hypothetical protein